MRLPYYLDEQVGSHKAALAFALIYEYELAGSPHTA